MGRFSNVLMWQPLSEKPDYETNTFVHPVWTTAGSLIIVNRAQICYYNTAGKVTLACFDTKNTLGVMSFIDTWIVIWRDGDRYICSDRSWERMIGETKIPQMSRHTKTDIFVAFWSHTNTHTATYTPNTHTLCGHWILRRWLVQQGGIWT